MINLKFANQAEAVTVLAAAGIAQHDAGGAPILPRTVFVRGVRVDVVPVNGSGVLMLPTGATTPGQPLPGGAATSPVPVMAVAPGFYLTLAWAGDTPPVFDPKYIDASSRNAVNAPAPNVAPLGDAKVAANKAILAFADMITSKVMAAYPAGEVATWQAQADEASSVVAGAVLPPNSLLPELTASATGTTPATLPPGALLAFAQKVLAARGKYFQIVAQVQKLRVQGQAAIAAAKTTSELDAAMAALKAKGQAEAQAMGLA